MAKNYTQRAKQLMFIAKQLVENLDDLLHVYQELMDEVDYNNPSENEIVLSVLIELEHNIVDILDRVHGQLYLSTGIYEPLPYDKVEDFEAAVLTTLANLDKVDLEDYRIEEFDDE